MVGRTALNFSEVDSTPAHSPTSDNGQSPAWYWYNESAVVRNHHRIGIATLISLCLVLAELVRTSSVPLNLDSIFHSDPFFVVVERHTPRAPTVQNAVLWGTTFLCIWQASWGDFFIVPILPPSRSIPYLASCLHIHLGPVCASPFAVQVDLDIADNIDCTLVICSIAQQIPTTDI